MKPRCNKTIFSENLSLRHVPLQQESLIFSSQKCVTSPKKASFWQKSTTSLRKASRFAKNRVTAQKSSLHQKQRPSIFVCLLICVTITEQLIKLGHKRAPHKFFGKVTIFAQ